jgi:BirA family biotin operon repressor/biotin-[acetyl-CoA-carboxylase] ligase
VWKSLQQLPSLGLEYYAVNGRGYRLADPIELLDECSILSQWKVSASDIPPTLQIFPVIDSTNIYLGRAAADGASSGSVCLAEYQSDGRGRRGRYWHSPYGSNIYLSVLWHFNDGMSRLGGLSLAVAVALMRCFNELGAREIGIKWPNDIITAEAKLAGILLEVAGESGGPCHAVIGIGVNYAMTPAIGKSIDQPWTNLRAVGVDARRNEVVAKLLNNIFDVLALYQRHGFEPFRQEWRRWDLLRDQAVTLHTANDSRDGFARGIDASGMLLVEHDDKTCQYASAEVSLRKAI